MFRKWHIKDFQEMNEKKIAEFGRLMHFMALRKKLEYRCVTGISEIGGKLARAFSNPLFGGNIPLLEEKKSRNGERVMVVDAELIWNKDNEKIEKIFNFKDKGLVVRNIILLSCEKETQVNLKQSGYIVHPLTTISGDTAYLNTEY